MDYIRAFIGFAIIIGIALFLGKLDHHKHPEIYTYAWIISIIVLLSLRWIL